MAGWGRQIRNRISFKSAAVFFLLMLFAILGNYFSISLLFGVDLLFGSIPLLIIVYLYGPLMGFMVSLAAGVPTYLLWNHPYAIMIFAVEILFVGILMNRYKRSNMILMDGLYWLFIGMPLVWVLYRYALNMDSQQILLVALKDTINGVLNAFIASCILLAFPLRKWVFTHKANNRVSVREALFCFVVAFILIPALFVSILSGYNEFRQITKDIGLDLTHKSEQTAKIVHNWHHHQLNALEVIAKDVEMLGFESRETLQGHIELVSEAFPDLSTLYVANSMGTTVAFTPAVNRYGESTIGIDFSDREYYLTLKRVQMPVTSDVFMGRGYVFEPTITMSLPIIRDNKFFGFTTATLSLNSIKELLHMVSGERDLRLTILDRNSSIIASTDPAYSVMSDFTKVPLVEEHGEMILQLMATDNHLPTMEKWKRSSYLHINHVNDELGWYIVVEMPFAAYQQKVYNIYNKSFGITLVIMTIAFLAAFVCSHIFTKPLVQLADITTSLTDKLFHKDNIVWPKSNVMEVDHLVKNLKITAYKFSENLKKLQDTNVKLEWSAGHDPLTGLCNRALFKCEFEQAINQAREKGCIMGIMFLDLDRFKRINDNLGHGAGDKVLIEVGERILDVLDKRHTLCRIGGDEFIILISEAYCIQDIEQKARDVLEHVQRPYLIGEDEFHITISIGISIFPNDGTNEEMLISNADIAMYQAKEAGRNNFRFFSANADTNTADKLMLENRLFKAMEQDELHVVYQPKINIRSGDIVGVEALLRWNNAELGNISPQEFIPVAEENGLIIPIGEWILHTACLQVSKWRNQGHPVKVSVNLSAKQFHDRYLTNKVRKILDETGLEPEWLELEITESTIVHDIPVATQILEDIREMGVGISLDDFGTGFSSLRYLKNFKIDTLKIDASFIHDLGKNKKDSAIVTTIITLARSLGMDVVAEGVETYEQLRFLKSQNCDVVQGYLFAKPLSSRELEYWLRYRIDA